MAVVTILRPSSKPNCSKINYTCSRKWLLRLRLGLRLRRQRFQWYISVTSQAARAPVTATSSVTHSSSDLASRVLQSLLRSAQSMGSVQGNATPAAASSAPSIPSVPLSAGEFRLCRVLGQSGRVHCFRFWPGRRPGKHARGSGMGASPACPRPGLSSSVSLEQREGTAGWSGSCRSAFLLQLAVQALRLPRRR